MIEKFVDVSMKYMNINKAQRYKIVLIENMMLSIKVNEETSEK